MTLLSMHTTRGEIRPFSRYRSSEASLLRPATKYSVPSWARSSRRRADQTSGPAAMSSRSRPLEPPWKIEGAYQDVLTWARQLGDAETFIARIDRPGSANDDMRTFVRTFKAHLRDAGSRDDDETVWGLLRKLQILIFDFTARGSASEELAKERAVRALPPDDALRAGNLWTSLVELALRIAASGGDRTRDD